MIANIHSFELRIAGVVIDRFDATFDEVRQRGDIAATRRGRPIECYCYNDAVHRWDFLGTYQGKHRYTSSFGEDRLISDDYKSMTTIKKGGNQ